MTRIIVAGGGTGGHLYPGIAIARALVRARPSLEPFFVGAKRGIEREILPKLEFPYLLLDAHPLYRRAVWNNAKTVVGGFGAWRDLSRLSRQERPAMVVGTGGYAAAFAMAHAVAHGVPIVQQAGDSHPGLTARAFSRWSREMYLSFPEAARSLRAHHPGSLIDTGAPIEPPPFPRPDQAAARRRWNLPETGHVILVYGGSQGSIALNHAVAEWIARGLPDSVSLIWGTGRSSFDQFKHHEAARVRVRDYLSPIADAYAAADFAVARAGAMTTAELFAWGIPAVLVPLPTAAADHQTFNAVTLERAGAAIHLPQSSLSAERLDEIVRQTLSSPDELSRLQRGAAARARPNAAAEIADRIVALLDGL